MMKSLPLTALAIVFVSSLHTAPAQAASRAWVASAGVDQPGCGAVASPCRTPQFAHDNVVAAGGEIDFFDPAGYGTITITKAISLVNDGVGTTGMIAPSFGNAITINANPGDAVQLRGLTIEGAGVGFNGVVFNSGGSLLVTNCVAQNFFSLGDLNTGNGILIQPTSGTTKFTISNTIVANNTVGGIAYQPPSGSPTANGVIDGVVATGNNGGIRIHTGQASGSTTVVAISNTVASNNSSVGIEVDNLTGAAHPFLAVSIDNVSATGNGTGIVASGTPSVLLGRSVVARNNVGVQNNIPVFFTYGDNRIDANSSGTDVSSPLSAKGTQ